MKKLFSEEQIIHVLKEAEAGATVKEVCRRHGISENTFYRWKAKFAGMDVSDVKRLRELEGENAKLKKLLAPRDRIPLDTRNSHLTSRDLNRLTIGGQTRRGSPVEDDHTRR